MPFLRASVLLCFAALFARADEAPGVFSWSGAHLAQARRSLAAPGSPLQPALARLRQDAAEARRLAPLSVMDKQRVPPSGDRHDYLSQAPYWWPDPENPTGPYLRKDGQQNPERLVGTDFGPWSRVSAAIETLGLAYYFTGDEADARHAAELVRRWFLDPATRMNPNLNYGQFVPGLNQGREEGVLEFHTLIADCDAVTLLEGSPAWTATDAEHFRAWLEPYYAWLTSNPLARTEAAAKNNHGTWCNAQVAGLALVLGRTAEARALLAAARTRRIATQIEPDGRQPLELARTKSLNYCLLNLEGLFSLARLSDQVGVDWWSYATADGRSLRAALAYLAPYADPARPWPRRDLVAGDRQRLFPLLAEAAAHDAAPPSAAALRTLGPGEGRWRLLWP